MPELTLILQKETPLLQIVYIKSRDYIRIVSSIILTTMINDMRAAIVFLCACAQNNTEKRMLYDFKQKKYYHYHLLKDSIRYSLYDYGRGSYLQGNLSQIFDTKTQSYISLKLEGNRFIGLDRQSGSHIYGNINNNLITVFDTQKNKYIHYAIFWVYLKSQNLIPHILLYAF